MRLRDSLAAVGPEPSKRRDKVVYGVGLHAHRRYHITPPRRKRLHLALAQCFTSGVPGRLPPGLYESLVTTGRSNAIRHLVPAQLHLDRSRLDAADAERPRVRHLAVRNGPLLDTVTFGTVVHVMGACRRLLAMARESLFRGMAPLLYPDWSAWLFSRGATTSGLWP